VLQQASGWKGLMALGGSLLGGSRAEVQRLRDLVQAARVLMREEDIKRLSLSLHRQRLSFP
jgi:ABC-type uncharacterized transport system YnjBCD ATPase subunit